MSALQRAVEVSGFEVAAVQVAVQGLISASSSPAQGVVGSQVTMALRDPQKVLEQRFSTLPAGAEVTLRGVLDLTHPQSVAVDICGVDITSASERKTWDEVTLPLCP